VFKEEAFIQASLSGPRMLERILLPSFGVTSVMFYGHQSELLWSFPSAGGCYPVEIYVVVRRLEGVDPGIYHYAALQTSLYKMADLDAVELLHSSLLEQDHNADFYFVVSIVPWRTCWKYSYKGYRFSLIDSGHVIANFQLILNALGLDHTVYTRTKSPNLKTLLNLDKYEETVGVIAVHRSPRQTSGVSDSLNVRVSAAECAVSSRETDIELFDWNPIFAFQDKVNRSTSQPLEPWIARHTLPSDWRDYNRVLQLIIDRRSSSAFVQTDISRSDFLHMLDFIQGTQMRFSIYLIVHAVNGIPPGIYHFDGELQLIAAGNFREACAGLCLGQTYIRDSSVQFFFAIDGSMMTEDDLSAYQQSSIDAGILGQMMYLKAQELSLGYSAIGGYYDEEVRELLQLPPHCQIIYSGAWGHNDPISDPRRKKDRYVLNRPTAEG
jgi:long-chain acyl-CoA synthetase